VHAKDCFAAAEAKLKLAAGAPVRLSAWPERPERPPEIVGA